MPTVFVLAPPAAHYLKHLERLPAECDLVVSDRAEAFAARAAQAEIAIVADPRVAPVLRELWPRLTSLQWVHAMLAGVEKVLFPELIASPVPLTNARGAYSKSLGEWAIAAMLYFAKDLPRLARQKNARHWEQFDLDELGRQTVGIVGYGDIGREVAKRAKAFGSRVIGLRRRPELSLEDPYLDLLLGSNHINDLMAESDYVVVATPFTPGTANLIGAPQIAAMKSTGVIINLGRGAAIDEPALVAALSEKRIRGAALDVFQTEPLPPGHPFWTLDNVLLSPHSADHTRTWMDESMLQAVDFLTRRLNGEPLTNVVDKQAGY